MGTGRLAGILSTAVGPHQLNKNPIALSTVEYDRFQGLKNASEWRIQSPGYQNKAVLLISLEITFFICGLLFALVVEEWVWDYAVTVTIIHIIITSVVMSEFPLMLHWWLALGSGVISMICGGQILAYCLFKDNFIYPVLDDF
nr:PREDICTED: transmembrane protein 244 [Apteryx mantelli mantelli]